MALDTVRHANVAQTRERLVVHEEIKDCRRCTFCFNGNGPVPYYGPTPNDIMILGDAPTRTDDRQGVITFKGDPGLLLRQILAAADLDLDRLFYANAISCWPEAGVPDRNLLACAPNLRRLVALCDPILVLALGSTALKVASDRKGRTITRDHGVPFRARAGPFRERWVFPTWHPAALKHRSNANAGTALRADILTFAEFYRGLKEEAPF